VEGLETSIRDQHESHLNSDHLKDVLEADLRSRLVTVTSKYEDLEIKLAASMSMSENLQLQLMTAKSKSYNFECQLMTTKSELNHAGMATSLFYLFSASSYVYFRVCMPLDSSFICPPPLSLLSCRLRAGAAGALSLCVTFCHGCSDVKLGIMHGFC
jgi:hypothetical protein